MRVSEEEIRSLGWNSHERLAGEDNITGSFMAVSQQLNYIGLLLLDIRDLLSPPNDE